MTSPPLNTLVVEDNPSEQWLISEVLRSRGHTVTPCDDAETAWALFREGEYGLVVLDWVLPGMDGLELCRTIRAHPRGDRCVVLMVTGKEHPDALARVLEAGADDYFTKPLDIPLLNIRLGLAERDYERVRRRHDAVAAMEASARELQTLFDNLEEVAFSAQADPLRLIQVSPAARRLLGVEPGVLLARADIWPELLFPKPWNELREELEALPAGAVLETEFRITRPDGSERWVQGRIKGQRNGDGRISRLDGILSDVTDSVQARRALSDQNEELGLLYSAAETLAEVDTLKEAVRTILPRLAAAAGLPIAILGMHEEERDRIRVVASHGVPEGSELPEALPVQGTLSGTSIRTGRPVVVADVRTRPDARAGFHEELGIRSVMAFPVKLRGRVAAVLTLAGRRTGEPSPGAVRMARGVADQLSGFLDRKAWEEELKAREASYRHLSQRLREANRELEAFTYTVSHDLRAPLRTMQGFAYTLLKEYGSALGDRGKDFARRIVNSGDSLEDLITALLEYSRLSYEEIALQPVDLNAVVQEAMELLEGDIRARGARVEVQPGLPTVRANHRTLVQMVSNLLGNGIKFTPEGKRPRVEITLEEGAAAVILSVRDHGVGIAEEHQERIFRTFERLMESQGTPGTGIGLAIVRKGAERIGGRVGVESQPGRGSRFWIEIPRSG